MQACPVKCISIKTIFTENWMTNFYIKNIFDRNDEALIEIYRDYSIINSVKQSKDLFWNKVRVEIDIEVKAIAKDSVASIYPYT